MVKTPTVWRTDNGFDTVTNGNAGFSLLLETGFHLLTETAFKLLLEDDIVTPKAPASWALDTKTTSSWEAADGFSTVTVGTGDARLTEQGDTRITEQADSRITELATYAVKSATQWVEL